jgi:hypothetical protein
MRLTMARAWVLCAWCALGAGCDSPVRTDELEGSWCISADSDPTVRESARDQRASVLVLEPGGTAIMTNLPIAAPDLVTWNGTAEWEIEDRSDDQALVLRHSGDSYVIGLRRSRRGIELRRSIGDPDEGHRILLTRCR